jgi:spermidine synthase
MTELPQRDPGRTLLGSIALASAAALSYEILLLRLFSIVHWHHTAYMVISLALLGYGASGSVLAIWGERWLDRFHRVWATALLLAGAAMLLCFLAAQRIAVHPEQLLWSPRSAVRLGAVYLLLAVPFLFIASALGLALMRYRTEVVYAGDLIGAGAGGVLVVLALYLMHPSAVLRAVVTLVLFSAWLGAGRRSRRLGVTALALALVSWLLPAGWTALDVSEYKEMRQLLRVRGAFIAAERSSPLGLVTAVESPQVPLRHAPGLSLAARRGPPEQVALFVDAGAATVVTDVRGGEATLEHLHLLTADLPYHLHPLRSVLVLGAGGGEQVLRAQLHGVPEVVAVELDGQVIDLVRSRYGELSGGLYDRPGVEVFVAEARGFASRETGGFDLVEHAVVGGFGTQSPGLHALAESYLYTVEAFDAYLDHVAPGGLLAMTVGVRTPARATVKLVATALEVLRQRGIEAPEKRLAVVRSWQTATVVIKNGELDTGEVARLIDFCRERMFDVVFYPGMQPEEANRYNRLATAEHHDAVVALTGPDAQRYLERSKFELAPATDERPFFHQYFRWRSLPEIVGLKGRGGLPLLEAGYLVLIVTLIQSVVASLLLVVLPAWYLSRRVERVLPSGLRLRVVVYFGGLGLGFLFLEVAFLQRLILVLHHPVLAAAVVLTSFLVFAGLGSAAGPRIVAAGRGRTLRVSLLLIAAVGFLVLAASGLATPWLVGAPTIARVAASVALLAPLAFLLGLPFPLGLDRLKAVAPELVPWAWGINGCASVVSPVLATLLAVHLGFSAVIAMALVLYLALMLAVPTPGRSATGLSGAA